MCDKRKHIERKNGRTKCCVTREGIKVIESIIQTIINSKDF